MWVLGHTSSTFVVFVFLLQDVAFHAYAHSSWVKVVIVVVAPPYLKNTQYMYALAFEGGLDMQICSEVFMGV